MAVHSRAHQNKMLAIDATECPITSLDCYVCQSSSLFSESFLFISRPVVKAGRPERPDDPLPVLC